MNNVEESVMYISGVCQQLEAYLADLSTIPAPTSEDIAHVNLYEISTSLRDTWSAVVRTYVDRRHQGMLSVLAERFDLAITNVFVLTGYIQRLVTLLPNDEKYPDASSLTRCSTYTLIKYLENIRQMLEVFVVL